MTYQLHPDAEQDLLDALAFYRQEAGRAVAERFIDAFEQTAKLIAENPSLGAPTNVSRRSFPLRGFPYSVIINARIQAAQAHFTTTPIDQIEMGPGRGRRGRLSAGLPSLK